MHDVDASGTKPDPVCRALYVPMRDGVRIAVDVWLPAGLLADERIGTVVRATRYHRAKAHEGVTDEARFWTERGYALVLIDARGSGASFGWRTGEFSQRERLDYGEVLDWIARQPWSNGRAGTVGASYEGNTAELMASLGNEHLRAVAPLFPDYDVYEDLVVPGGMRNWRFLDTWLVMCRAIDGIDGAAEEALALERQLGEPMWEQLGMTWEQQLTPKPVDGPDGPALRAAAIRDHQRNVDLRPGLAAMRFKDDAIDGFAWDDGSLFPLRRATERAGVPMLTAASWLDTGTANGSLARFATLDVPQEAYIGAWSHGAEFTVDPFAPADQRSDFQRPELLERIREFFDRHVQRGEPARPGRTLHYYTHGTGAWRTTETWPLPELETIRWYARDGGELAPTPPTEDEAADSYRLDPAASAGETSRWGTAVSAGGNVVYPDRAQEDGKLLTYTSAPLERDVHVAGTVVVTLALSSTREDGTVIAYLEDVAPDGRVTYVTEGQLWLATRRLAEHDEPHRVLRTPRSYARADAAPMTPGEVEQVRFDLLPTSALLRAGHRLRIALAGTDASHFELLPGDGEATYTVHRDASRPSYVDLPVAGATA